MGNQRGFQYTAAVIIVAKQRSSRATLWSEQDEQQYSYYKPTSKPTFISLFLDFHISSSFQWVLELLWITDDGGFYNIIYNITELNRCTGTAR